eukprot:6184975-Pleurochrysis_carterae.AAC.2
MRVQEGKERTRRLGGGDRERRAKPAAKEGEGAGTADSKSGAKVAPLSHKSKRKRYPPVKRYICKPGDRMLAIECAGKVRVIHLMTLSEIHFSSTQEMMQTALISHIQGS